jgi:two-component system nitrate/nitrite response regulator NarL
MLTVSDQAEDLMAALQAGADGYLLKDMEPEELMQQLAEAARGKITISDRLTQLLVTSLRDKARPTNLSEAGLTEQENRILEHLIAGKSNKLIARDMDIAEGTVKVHIKHLLKKLNLRSRVEAAVWAIAAGARPP